jgi:Ni/Fe-hydrogenase subunit HybB-like protein
MEIELKPIEGKSPRYIAALVVLSILVIGGVFSTYRMATKGVYLSGMSNRVPWGLEIIAAVFYIGLSAGSLTISGLYGIFGKKAYKPFARLAAYSAVLFLVAALLSIITDQGRVDRVFKEPFLHFNPRSMFSVNPVLYLGYIFICIVYQFALFNEKQTMTKVIATVGVAWAILTHTGTGFIFASVQRELYSSPLLPACFVTAALSSGTACMILIIVSLFKITKRPLDVGIVTGLGRLLAVFVMVTLYLVVIENFHRYCHYESRNAALFFLFGGMHSALFWIGMVLLGSAVPLVLLLGKKGKSVPWVVLSAVLVILGVFCERYLIVIPGLIHPPDLFPGMTVRGTVLNEGVATYSIAFYEILQALGILSFIGLGLLLGLKLLRLLPTEARSME